MKTASCTTSHAWTEHMAPGWAYVLPEKSWRTSTLVAPFHSLTHFCRQMDVLGLVLSLIIISILFSRNPRISWFSRIPISLNEPLRHSLRFYPSLSGSSGLDLPHWHKPSCPISISPGLVLPFQIPAHLFTFQPPNKSYGVPWSRYGVGERWTCIAEPNRRMREQFGWCAARNALLC